MHHPSQTFSQLSALIIIWWRQGDTRPGKGTNLNVSRQFMLTWCRCFDVICSDSEEIAMECFEIIEFLVMERRIELVSIFPSNLHSCLDWSRRSRCSLCVTVLGVLKHRARDPPHRWRWSAWKILKQQLWHLCTCWNWWGFSYTKSRNYCKRCPCPTGQFPGSRILPYQPIHLEWWLQQLEPDPQKLQGLWQQIPSKWKWFHSTIVGKIMANQSRRLTATEFESHKLCERWSLQTSPTAEQPKQTSEILAPIFAVPRQHHRVNDRCHLFD